jgi:CheY-like chemotaxis protein/PAS domain-containing protein
MADATSAQQFRLLLAHNPRPMWVHDAETLEFLEINDAAVIRYEYPREEFLQLRATAVCAPDELTAALHDPHVATASGYGDGPWRHRSRSGASFEVETVRHSVQYEGRQAVLVVVDDKLASALAHDFNNVLTVIAGRSRFLLRHIPKEDARRRDVELIAAAVDRATELTQQLRSFDRKASGQDGNPTSDTPRLRDVALASGVVPERLTRRPGTRGLVLIVDDDPDVSSLLARDLEEAGYGVTTVDDGEKALTAVIKEEPDVVLLDLGMPRLNGIETLGALRAIAPMLQVIIVSGAGTPQDAARARAFCAFDYVSKPVDAGYLVGRVEAALHVDYEGHDR